MHNTQKSSYIWTLAPLELFSLLILWEVTLYTNDVNWRKIGIEIDKALEKSILEQIPVRSFTHHIPVSDYMVFLRTKPISLSNTSPWHINFHKKLQNGIRCILEIISWKELLHKSTKQHL